MINSFPFTVLLTCTLWVLCASSALGQPTLLRGFIVHAADERPVVGRIRVTAMRVDIPSSRPVSVVSDEYGYFQFPPLSPGQYRVTILLPPFQPHVEIVTVARDPIATVMLRLQLRDAEDIAVRSQGSSGARLLMSDGSTGATFSREDFESLPQVNGRTVQSMLALVPGIVFTDSVGTLAQFTAVGQRRFANRMTIDGVSADLALDVRGGSIGEAASGGLHAMATSGGTQILVSREAIEEVTVRTSTASAEHARTPGAQTSIITRAGGDTLSVSGFTVIRPNAWSASDWFANAGRAPERENSLTNVGASVGGPAGGKWRYFATWERQKLSRATTTTIEVPSLAARDAAREPLRQILDAFPVPNGRAVGAGLAEYTNRIPVGSTLWALSGRLDSVGVRHRYFIRGNGAKSAGDALAFAPFQVPFLSYSRREATATRTATGGWTWFGTKAFDDLRLNLSAHGGRLDYGVAKHGGAQPLALEQLMQSRSNAATIFVVFPGPYGTVATGRARDNEHRQFQVSNTVTVSTGRHEFKAGIEYSHVATSLTSAQHVANIRFGGINRLLQGVEAQATLLQFEPAAVGRHAGAAFVQDTWRVSDSVSIDYGFRYSVAAAPLSSNEHQPLLLDFYALPERRVLPAGTRLWRTSWSNVAPRIGLAYKTEALAARPTVLRAGWGRAFDALTSPGASAFGGGYPYTTGRQELVQFPMLAQDEASIPGPFQALDLSEYYAFPKDFPNPLTVQWQVAVDQEAAADQRVSLAYVGARGRSLAYWFAYPSAGRMSVNAFAPLGESDYHALLAEYAKRLSHGWQARASYTWSHAIDTDSGESMAPNAPPSVIPVASNRGNADFDRRHTAMFSASYQFRASRRWPKALWVLCEGWDVAGSIVLRSGAPFSVMFERMIDAASYQLRMDAAPALPIWLPDDASANGRRLNPDAFVIPNGKRQGSIGRNSLRASPLRQADMSVSRIVRWDRASVGVKFEVFNVFNTPSFGKPTSDFQASPFGVPFQSYADALGSGTLAGGGLAPLQQQGGPRAMQLGLTLRF